MSVEADKFFIVSGAYQEPGHGAGLTVISEIFVTDRDLAQFIIEHPQCRDAGEECLYEVQVVEIEADSGPYGEELTLRWHSREIKPYTYVTVGYKED